MRLLTIGLIVSVTLSESMASDFCENESNVAQIENPVLFVTQMPIPDDFGTIGSTFLNHEASMRQVGRGGDLYIRYPDGQLCNLTRKAGFGNEGFQGDDAIAVRDPAVHFSGTKAIFSMVVGAPSRQFQVATYFWQLYEVSGLAQGDTVVITKVPNQPENYNNVMPAYASDGDIIFVSDRPRNGERHLYPQLDEYESTPITSGLWKLRPTDGRLDLLQHSPSGSSDPIVDSFGRVIFTRWDHLVRDQQSDADDTSGNVNGTFDYLDESVDAVRTTLKREIFPEPRSKRPDLLDGTNLVGSQINHFFPWMINQDGTEEETLNHLGRHELHQFFARAINDDSNIIDFTAQISGRTNPNPAFNFFYLREDPQNAGRFFAVDAPEFTSHASGNILALNAAPNNNPDDIVIEYVTHPDTGTTVPENEAPPQNHAGHFREPLPMSDGSLLSVHADETRAARNIGSRSNPVPRYRFRVRKLTGSSGGFQVPVGDLTDGIRANVSYFDPDVLVSYSGDFWELNPVEVRERPVPPDTTEPPIAEPELTAISNSDVSLRRLRTYLWQNGLALMVVRDVTSRDDADKQQPYNLRVVDGTSTGSGVGTTYDVERMQFVQADQVRGIGGIDNPRPGRRVLARFLHDPRVMNANPPTSVPGGWSIFGDGSMAAFLPANRALSWQLLAPDNTPIVRERYWITFQPGEIRVCDGCHGVNRENQAQGELSDNSADALVDLLQWWDINAPLFQAGFEEAPQF